MSDGFLSLGFAAVDWIEHYLVHGPGDVQGQPIELDDELAAFIVKAYRVDRNGDRMVRRAFLSRPKGRNKSGLAAMIACFEALGPCRFDHFATDGEISAWGYEYEAGEPVGRPLTYVEILNVATEEGQAGNTYDAIFYMLHPETCSSRLSADFGKIDVGLTRTNMPNRRGYIEPITTADSSKDGGKSTFIVADETHLWVLPRLKRLHGVMARNLLKRKIASGWMLETSTMYGEGEESVAEGTHAYAKAVASGRKKDRTLLFDHRQASEKWNLNVRQERLKALREVYGPAAAWMNLDAIGDSWDDPQVSEAEFRRYWLNQPVPMTDKRATIFGSGVWEDAVTANGERPKRVAFGFAVSPDLSAAWIATVGLGGDGKALGVLTEILAGTAGLVDRLAELAARWEPCAVVFNPAGAAAAFEAALVQAGFSKDPDPGEWRLQILSAREYAQACMGLVGDVLGGKFRHLDEAPLNAAVRGAQKRLLGDGWAWSRKDSSVDIGPLEAMTLANFGFATHGAYDPDEIVWAVRA